MGVPSEASIPTDVATRGAAHQSALAPGPRLAVFGIEIDVVTMREAVERVVDWIRSDQRCRYVVTPNVDHVVMLQSRSDLRAVYREASLVLADGWPVVAASRLLETPLPERVAGSDLVPSLFGAASAAQPLRVFLLGAAPGVAPRAAENIKQRWPHVDVAGTYSPPLGFERDAGENQRIVEMVNSSESDLLVVGLGAPKQELWIGRHQTRLNVPAALCVGATIDFLAGHQRRAPRWMRRCGLEWFHRLAREPRRLLRRYARDAVIFPSLVLREVWTRQLRRALRR